MTTSTHTEPTSITTRTLDPTLTAVDLDGRLLAFAYQDSDTGWWLIQDRMRLGRPELGDFATVDAAVGYIIDRAGWFDTCPFGTTPRAGDVA